MMLSLSILVVSVSVSASVSVPQRTTNAVGNRNKPDSGDDDEGDDDDVVDDDDVDNEDADRGAGNDGCVDAADDANDNDGCERSSGERLESMATLLYAWVYVSAVSMSTGTRVSVDASNGRSISLTSTGAPPRGRK